MVNIDYGSQKKSYWKRWSGVTMSGRAGNRRLMKMPTPSVEPTLLRITNGGGIAVEKVQVYTFFPQWVTIVDVILLVEKHWRRCQTNRSNDTAWADDIRKVGRLDNRRQRRMMTKYLIRIPR